MAAAAVAGARDATRLESLVCFFKKYFIFYFTNVYFRAALCVETVMAAPAAAGDARDVAGDGDGTGDKRGFEMRRVSSPGCIFFWLLVITILIW